MITLLNFFLKNPRLSRVMALMISIVPVPSFADVASSCLSSLLNLVDRPSAADNACVVPMKKVILELGYQHLQGINNTGILQNYPQPNLRVGLPANSELYALLPNYNQVTLVNQSGFSSTGIGVKHLVAFNKQWLVSLEGTLIFSGSRTMGNASFGGITNLIISYSVNTLFNLTGMIGISRLSDSSSSGGRQYTSFNPIVNLAFSPSETLNLYGEIYSQTKAGGRQGGGVNIDVGMLYLVTPTFAVDFSVGQRVAGSLENFTHYWGAGLTAMF